MPVGPGSQDLTGNGTSISEMNYSAAALQLTFLLGQLNTSPQTFAEEEACALTGPGPTSGSIRRWQLHFHMSAPSSTFSLKSRNDDTVQLARVSSI